MYCSSSVLGQAAGKLTDLSPEAERWRLQPGAGLHGESLHLWAGQGFLPRLIPHGKQEHSPSHLLCTAALLLACRFIWALTMYMFSCRISSGLSTLVSAHVHRTVICSLLYLHTDFLFAFRWRPVCGEALQEWSHVFGQRGRLRLRLQVGFHRCPLWKWWDVQHNYFTTHSVCLRCYLPLLFPDETQCIVESGRGCSQFCKPGYTSYECSCAQGWKLSRTDKNKCEPAGTSGFNFRFELKLKSLFCFFIF